MNSSWLKLATAALLLCLTPLLPQRAIADVPKHAGNIRIEYLPSDNATYYQINQALQTTRFYDDLAKGLDRSLDLPSGILVTFKECGDTNAFYDPAKAQIVMCYELIQLLAKTSYPGDELSSEDYAYSSLFIFLHELGHAMVDQYQLPITGREEDTADSFAAVFLIRVKWDNELIWVRLFLRNVLQRSWWISIHFSVIFWVESWMYFFFEGYVPLILSKAMKPTSPSAPQTDAFKFSDEQYASLVERLRSTESQELEHGEVEQIIWQEGTELLRRLFQSHLDERYQNESAQVNLMGSDGEKRPHRRNKCQRQLATLFGEVVVSRLGYSSKQSGVSALYPVDGQLNLAPDQYSDGVRKRVSTTAALVSFSETSQTMGETTGAQVGKRQCEELIVKVSQDFEDFYAQRAQESAQTSQDLLVLTTDGKGIVMHGEDLRAATAKAAQASAKNPKTRLSPGEKRQRKRMATVAAVYSTPRFIRHPEQIIGHNVESPQRPDIANKRVWASVEQDAQTVIGSAFDEAVRRDPQHQREWVVLVDGEERQLDYVKAAAQREGVSVTIILDFIHVLEYLWKAAFCFVAPGTLEAETWVMDRALRILQGKTSDVAAGIRRSATLQNLADKERENADKCADYLLKYRAFLRYDTYLAKGYPIATGVIEGACRHLICDRMDITGARWRLDRAEAVLKIRALRSSGDFESYWQFHKLQEFQRNHVSKFQEPKRLLAA